MEYKTEALANSHNKKEFNCGNQMLDEYLKKQARQDMKRNLAACFVTTGHKSNTITGYYTLSSTSISQSLIPKDLSRKLPKSYSNIPATLLGRLARDISTVRTGMGELLLMDALFRAFLTADSIGSYAVVVDPIDQKAEDFYKSYGFILLPDSKKMFLPMKTIAELFN
jgi:hypothetical protein